MEIKEQCKYEVYSAMGLYFFPVALLSLKFFLRHWLLCLYRNVDT